MTGLQTRLIKPGVLELHSEDYTLQMKYNPFLVAIDIEEKMFRNEISRITFNLINTELSGNMLFEIVKAR